GAPILMMLFLPETNGRERVPAEILLDLFQLVIVVGLIYSTFFFLPESQMLAADANYHSISLSDMQSLVLLIAGFVRLQFARVPETRNLLLRLTLFLLTCAIATYVGDWVALNYPAYVSFFDFGWSVPYIVAGLIAVTWTPVRAPKVYSETTSFLGFLG